MLSEASGAQALQCAFGGDEDLTDLAVNDKQFDNDGFAAEFCNEGLNKLAKIMVGRHAIHPLGAEGAKNRMLYDPARYAMIGLQRPERRQGVGLAVARNHCQHSLDDIGKLVILSSGESVTLTVEMVDDGLEELHAYLRRPMGGQGFTQKTLKRLAPGSHAVWEIHPPIMIAKLLRAAHACQLSVILFDIGLKASPDDLPQLHLAFDLTLTVHESSSPGTPGTPPRNATRTPTSTVHGKPQSAGQMWRWRCRGCTTIDEVQAGIKAVTRVFESANCSPQSSHTVVVHGSGALQRLSTNARLFARGTHGHQIAHTQNTAPFTLWIASLQRGLQPHLQM
jgi:hypothetical protein